MSRATTAGPLAHPPVHGWRAWVVSLVVVADVLATVGFALAASEGDPISSLVLTLIFGGVVGSFGVVGAVLVLRLPRNPIGWIFWLTSTVIAWALVGVSIVESEMAVTGGTVSAPVALLAVVANGALIPVIGVAGIFVPFLFPTGRLPDRRWRWAAGYAGLAIGLGTLYSVTTPGPLSGGAELANPIGIDALAPVSDVVGAIAIGLLLLAFVLSVSSVIWRYRHARSVERQQLRWFAVSAMAMLVAIALWVSAIGPFAESGWIVMFAGLGLVPVATGLAIMRYRLYDLDRLISRSVAYGLLTGVLVATYGALILILSGPLEALTGGGSVSVAISTLVVAALFQPIRGRIQRIVDRRFDRARYDAELTSTAFAERLRDEVDLPTLLAGLEATVHGSISPSFVGIWMRAEPSR